MGDISTLFASQKIMTQSDERLHRLIYRWQSPIVFFMAAGATFFVIMSLYMITSTFSEFSVVFTLFTLAYSYFVFSLAINKTTIEISDTTMTVKHGPLPWRGNCTARIEEITSFYCEELRSKGVVYNVRAVLNRKTGITLLSGLDNPDVCKAVIKQLETWKAGSQRTKSDTDKQQL